jgi:peptidyl-prolyl cis-trans isomerase D
MLALAQLQNAIINTPLVTEWELHQLARLLNQRRDIAYLPFTTEGFSRQMTVSDEDVEIRYRENELDYQTEESVDVAYVELSADALIDDESIEVLEDELVSAYETEVAASLAGDRRQGRHILLQITPQQNEEQARSILLEFKEQLESGADFAELARAHSDDPGSAAQGGELGMVGKGIFDPEFENVLWSLGEGELSDPVVTSFGVHLIRLDDVEVVVYPPFEDQRDEIALRLRGDQAARLFIDRLRELDNLAFEQPDGLAGIAAELGLELQTVEGVSRSRGEGVFTNVQVRDAVFSPDVLDNGFNTPAVEMTGDRAVVAHVGDRHGPELIPLIDVADVIRETIVGERARVLAEESHAKASARITAGENVSTVADDYDVRWQTFELADRNLSDVPRLVLEAAFELPRPGAGTKSVGQSALPENGLAVVTVTRVVDGDLAIMAESEIDNLRGVLNSRSANLDFSAFFATLEQDASISRHQ